MDDKRDDLDLTLKQCSRAAKKGYKLAKNQYDELNNALNDASEKIENTLLNANSSSCYVSEATKALENQLISTRESIEFVSASLIDDIISSYERLEFFSISLFGKTMVGKSTLMEFLTNGNGDSIGKGAQRTTKDIRTYKWNSLRITDVPGVGAFEGEEDEKIAFEEAKKSDLILFLFSDDSVQSVEADWFSKIVNLGKPIICVINVKCTLREKSDVERLKRTIEKSFDIDRLDILKNQFLEYSSSYGQDWKNIKFVYVHLDAAYKSQNFEDAYLSKTLREASRIDELTDLIINEVFIHGKYYREKTFIDLVSVPTINVFEDLLYQANLNVNLKNLVDTKRDKLDDWLKKYRRDSKKTIMVFVKSIKSKLILEIPDFVDEHFNDKKVEQAWKKVIDNATIEKQCEDIFKQLNDQVDDKLKELSREIEKELKCSESIIINNLNGFRVKRIVDTKRVWNWSAIVTTSGLFIASEVLKFVGSTAAGPVGWAALGASVIGGIGSYFFKSREQKEDKARKRLEYYLRKNVDNICESILQNLEKSLDNLIKTKIKAQSKELMSFSKMLDELANTQLMLAQKLWPILLMQNKQVVKETLGMIGGAKYYSRIDKVLRVPGDLMVILLNENESFPPKKGKELSSILQEKLTIVKSVDEMCMTLLGEPYDVINQKLLLSNEDHFSNIDTVNNLRIIQQLDGTYIGAKEKYNV